MGGASDLTELHCICRAQYGESSRARMHRDSHGSGGIYKSPELLIVENEESAQGEARGKACLIKI
jgi:hypothetical protein